MSKPERILTRHYKNGEINARPDDDPWCYPRSKGCIGEGLYIRADLGSFYQEKDIDALMAERDAAITALGEEGRKRGEVEAERDSYRKMAFEATLRAEKAESTQYLMDRDPHRAIRQLLDERARRKLAEGKTRHD